MKKLLRKLNPFGADDPVASLMQRHGEIDIVAFDRPNDRVVLSIVETRPWGDGDETLFDLQEKLNT